MIRLLRCKSGVSRQCPVSGRQPRGRLTSQYRAVKLGVGRHLNETDIGRELVAGLDDQDIARDNVDCHDSDLYSLPDDETPFWNHVLDGCHDTGRRPILPHVEGGLDEPDSNQDNGKRQVSQYRGVAQRSPCNEDEDGANKKHGSEALEEVAKPLFEAMGLGRRWHVLSMLFGFALDLALGQAPGERGRQTSESFVYGNCVPFEVGKICFA